jgi:SAM-dependent methyltransferase
MDSSHPSHPEFWNGRYLRGQTPWDFGGVPANVKAYLKARPQGGRVLIPGCGCGHEIKAFADAGYEVTAIDLAPAAVERARQIAGPALAQNSLVGDFFQHDFGTAPFDVIYERTFLCALLPDRREAYRNRVADLLKPRGALIGYFYYAPPDLAAGPPFGFAWATADELFGRYFLLLKDLPVADSLPVFVGRERWQEQSRTPYLARTAG